MQHHQYNRNPLNDPVQGKFGFSLVELLLVLVITSILILIAVPSYRFYLEYAKRIAAQTDLLGVSLALEKYYLEHYSYQGATLNSGEGNTLSYAPYSPSEEAEDRKQFDLVIDSISADGESYVLKAEPIHQLAAHGQGAMYYFSDGRRGWDKNNNGQLEQSEYCWRCE